MPELAEDLEAKYLASTDPRGQSGFRGDPARWDRLRRPVVEAVHRDGDFLDVGCANGHFLESAVGWALGRGFRIEPYGIDKSAALIALAQARLPKWADRFEVADAMTYAPARRFDFVR